MQRSESFDFFYPDTADDMWHQLEAAYDSMEPEERATIQALDDAMRDAFMKWNEKDKYLFKDRSFEKVAEVLELWKAYKKACAELDNATIQWRVFRYYIR